MSGSLFHQAEARTEKSLAKEKENCLLEHFSSLGDSGTGHDAFLMDTLDRCSAHSRISVFAINSGTLGMSPLLEETGTGFYEGWPFCQFPLLL